MDEQENTSSNPRIGSGVRTISDLIEVRLSRRTFVAGLGASAVLPVAACSPTEETPVEVAKSAVFDFPEITRGLDGMHHVAEGYRADILLRWGDPLFADSPAFDPFAQTAEAQERQFGYNNDYVGYWPLEETEGGRGRGLLCVNHEYTSTPLMFPGLAGRKPTGEECAVELAAHGGTVVEIKQGADGLWETVVASPYNRRITAGSTPMELTGPVAGDPRVQTSEDPSGRRVMGTMNNCAGGITPWGTYLMAEENFNGNFLGSLEGGHPETESYARYGIPGGWYNWGVFVDRFDVSKEPNEPNRFGWVVEVDILDPQSTPKKRTALGRFKHEGAESIIAPDGRVVVYMGDDQRFDYVYKYVSTQVYTLDDREANMDLLEDGTLYVARFDDDGTVVWLPLIFGEGPLTPENGFQSQADVLIDTRLAADAVGATPMDRPEDVEPHPTNGRVYVMLTNNIDRTADQIDAANPRANNDVGHIIEIIEPEGDFAATESRWEILVRCGDPTDPEAGATWNSATSENGWFGSPDNCAIDPSGRLWVSTDGNQVTGAADGLWALATDGEERGAGQAFFRTPVGAELCGPRFTKDGKSLFLAVQHPGDGDDATFEAPMTRWPDFAEGQPPRPSVMVIRRNDGGTIGS